MRLGTRRPLHRQLRSNVGSYSEVHQRTFLMFKGTVEGPVYLRASATKEWEKGAQIPVGYNPRTPDFLSLGATSSDAVGSGFCKGKFVHHFGALTRRSSWHQLLPRTFDGSTPSMLVGRVAIPPISPTFPQRRRPQGCTRLVRAV